ncbi:predicted dioxygenase [Longilinea arvoryzae]|uniref:Predicted dioxygenase n=1 Tax=Longilinea arvoryzae TaxID=360412 RepID=A0A0S7BJP2_9CHLR|nr:AmmeMemoRadiSam system protein B [Longilinea arvoryzae]GAP14021.1 predicted dioxygenase [Longilinea arvoryzae]
MVADVRPSPIAGTWYSADPQRLAHQVDAFLQSAVLPPLSGEVIGLVSPHAGHRYSGRTAGHAFRAVQGQHFDLVAVISPLHGFYPADLLTTAHKAYGTPLGTVWVDGEVLDALDENIKVISDKKIQRISNDTEHSLEIELPFLQRALEGEFKLLPVMVRSQSKSTARALGEALGRVLAGKRALLVASTDLSHFYPEETADQLDAVMLKQIADFSPDGVFRAEESGTGFACGYPAVAAVLWAARALGGNSVEILHHSTSADETGDRGEVVGYGAAAILKQVSA